ncbi:MAG: hypothetical protein AB3N17_03870 [Tateyamaria sp.]
MKAMMMGFVALIVISVGAYFALQELGFSSDAVNSGDAVRLD